MPAIITHDFFGKDVYATCARAIGPGPDARQAFLLGNQGPDPLFYLALHPLRMRNHLKLGTRMHRTNADDLLMAFKNGLDALTDSEKIIGSAYIAGFLCHYLLDSTLHPFVYSQQYAFCGAGIPGLDESDGEKVHMLIEREFDEIVLYSRLAKTVESYKPHEEILHANDAVLLVIGKLFVSVAREHFGIQHSPLLYPLAVKGFRTGQRFFYSHKKVRGRLVPALEKTVMRSRYSFYSALSHRANPSAESIFANAERSIWENPFTQAQSRLGFWDLYREAFEAATTAVPHYLSPSFTREDACALTHNVDFRGKPVLS